LAINLAKNSPTKLPDNIKDFISAFTSNSASQTKNILSHCRRELMHEVWRHLLTADFLHAYQHGIVIKCLDGIFRRFYPRIFTYSADYPEKLIRPSSNRSFFTHFLCRVLLATIRNRGACPCPRCKTLFSDIYKLGFISDMNSRISKARVYAMQTIIHARRFIYSLGLPVAGAAVNRLLQAESLVPTVVCLSYAFILCILTKV
jgi:hypothetical protein